jgi:uncharacterized protein (TIGR03435 family)
MTRQLLADRFGLKVRIDSELVPATVLRVIKPGVLGLGIRPAPEGCNQPPLDARIDERFAEAFRRSCHLTMFGRIRGTVTLDEFARLLSLRAGRAILNRTDLGGLFTIDVAVDVATLVREAPSPLVRARARIRRPD